jgi:hypothetical protein
MVALVVVKIVVPALGGTGVVQFAPVASHAATASEMPAGAPTVN